MTEDDVFKIAARWTRWRYLFDDGKMLDVDSPYNSDSNDRGLVLIEAARRWGKRDDRKIAGSAKVGIPEP